MKENRGWLLPFTHDAEKLAPEAQNEPMGADLVDSAIKKAALALEKRLRTLGPKLKIGAQLEWIQARNKG
ncbi:hypothetical protein L195_g055427 [Trifolium pratense]|uniref:Uncharacterized protein n=1 Tax=Trifolium pratense TaxID=57577 RepID=A0A2K3KL94_TRIPR|nr:hypothetical protein L195_g055427 [Trifolium pratense]